MLSDAERAGLARQDAAFLSLPLRPGDDARAMAAHLRRTVTLLRESGCREAVAYVASLYDRSIAPHGGIACRKGCAFCCVQTVIVTAAEAFAVAAEIRDRDETVAAVLAAPPRRLGEPKSDWRACLLLGADDACSVYAARPLACHGFVSFDLQACIEFFADRSDTASFTPNDHQQMLTVCRMMLNAAHLLTGHGGQPGYELSGAVAAILRTPDAEARWRKGEDILQDVPQGPPIPPAFAAEISRMAAFVAPTL